MTPRQLADFVVGALVEGYGKTGVLPTGDWLAFDIVDAWPYGPIGLSGHAHRHPTLDLMVVTPKGESPTFILPGRSKAQFDRFQGYLSSGLVSPEQRHGSQVAPRRGDWTISSRDGLRVVVSVEVTPARADPQALQIRATRLSSIEAPHADHSRMPHSR